MYDTTAALRPSIQNPSERISFIVSSFPLCLTFSWKWSMFRLVTWELLHRTIGCLTSKGKVEFSSLPPTLISPFSSMKWSNFKRKLWLEILAFCFFRLKLIMSFFYSHGICLKMCLSASCCSATVVLAVLAVLLERSLEVWNHSYCLCPGGKSSYAVNETEGFLDHSRTHSGLNFQVSNLNVRNLFFTGQISLSQRNAGPLNQLDFISSSAFKPLKAWSTGLFLVSMYRHSLVSVIDLSTCTPLTTNVWNLLVPLLT